jgi:putative lipoic acid-binding regulatory protein
MSSHSNSYSLLTFPSIFPIKVMGLNVDALIPALCEIALLFDPLFQSDTLELRPSKAGNYIGVTLHINATSKTQLDNLYRSLSSHPLVKVVL